MTQLQIDTKRLEEIYSFIDRQAVLNFLTPELVEVLLEAPAHIYQYFPNAPLSLQVVADAEDSTWVELVLRIKTELEPEEAIEVLHELDDNWWFDKPYDGIREKMEIGVEYNSDEL